MQKSTCWTITFAMLVLVGATVPAKLNAQEVPASADYVSPPEPRGKTGDEEANAPEAPLLKGEPHSGGSVQEELEAIRRREDRMQP